MFADLLQKKRAPILERWRTLILGTYPQDTSQFLRSQKDRFLNPVGHTIKEETETLFGEFLGGMNKEKVTGSLDRIIRIRSVQDFDPSQAVTFVFLLKGAIREVLQKEIREDRLFEELSEFDGKVDEMALVAVDIFMKCRETIYELRIKELKKGALFRSHREALEGSKAEE